MKRRYQVIVGALAFGIAVSSGIAWVSGSPQLGLHGGFWISLVFALWLESHLPDSRSRG